MWKQSVLTILVVGLLTCSTMAGAQDLSQMLESGIYTEETMGDLDAAIKIYDQVIAEAKTNRRVLAQAQLRRGQCLLKLGKTAEATKVFQELVAEFKSSPDQRQLVEQAEKLLPEVSDLALDPVPWVDGEQLELRIKLAGGLEIGDFILSAQSGNIDGHEVWTLSINRYIGVNAPNLGLSQVVADRQTFRPIHSLFRHTLLGTIEADYSRSEVAVRATGVDGKQSERTTHLDKAYYDNEQGMHLFRRLPLKEGYTGKLPISATFGGGPMELETEVTGRETVEVPAGKFDCYRLLVKPVQQTFWVSTEARRYLVKFEAGGITGVLQSIREVKPGDETMYEDPAQRFSLSAPANWYLIPDMTSVKPPEALIMLVDPEAIAVSALHVRPLDKLALEHRQSVRAWAEKETAENKETREGFQIRADSWQERTVAGHPAVSCVADFTLSGRKRTQYFVFALGESTANALVAHTEQAAFDAYRPKLDSIIDTYRAK